MARTTGEGDAMRRSPFWGKPRSAAGPKRPHTGKGDPPLRLQSLKPVLAPRPARNRDREVGERNRRGHAGYYLFPEERS